jgi:hypothetical protein
MTPDEFEKILETDYGDGLRLAGRKALEAWRAAERERDKWLELIRGASDGAVVERLKARAESAEAALRDATAWMKSHGHHERCAAWPGGAWRDGDEMLCNCGLAKALGLATPVVAHEPQP